MQQVAHAFGFQQSLIPVYHPEANPVERKNRDLKTRLAILTSKEHAAWSEHLAAVRFAMNTTVCQSTSYTAAYLTFGRELRTTDDVARDMRAIIENDNFVCQITPYLLNLSSTLQKARETHEKAQDARTEAKNQNRRDQSYDVGDKVLITSHNLSNASHKFTAKFTPKRDGPYRIMKVVTPTTYIVASEERPDVPLGKYHVSAFTPYKEAEGNRPTPMIPLRKRGRPPGQQPEVNQPASLSTNSKDPTQEDTHEELAPPEPELCRRPDTPIRHQETEGRRKRTLSKRRRCPCCVED